MAKIYFIYFDLYSGSFSAFPHGLAYIIGTLKSDNNNVIFGHLRNDSDYESVIESIENNKPDIVGFSFSTTQKKYVRRFLDIYKPTTKLLIAGGIHPRLVKEQVFNDFPAIDGVCVGEGEIPLRELCHRFDAGGDYLHTPGFYFRTDTGIIKNPIEPLYDLDSLPLPDYSLFDYKRMIREGGGYYQMMLSRGCPHNCTYCASYALLESFPNKNRFVRYPSPSRAINIVKNNLSLYPYPKTKLIAFTDDVFTLNKKWLFSFCEMYKKEIKVPFMCLTRVENISDDIARCLRDAGCVVIEFGVESGNEWMRRHVLNRKYSNETVENALRVTKKYGIKRGVLIMIGLPFETNRMQVDTIELCRRLRTELGIVTFFFPFPGTKLWQVCSEYNLMLDNLEDRASGLFNGPSLKEIFNSHKNTVKNYQVLQLFFYLRLVSPALHIPIILENMLFRILMLTRKIIFPFIDKSTESAFIIRFIQALRRFVLKNVIFRQG